MHIMTKDGWKLLGGPMRPVKREGRWWHYPSWSPASADTALAAKQLGIASTEQEMLVRFEEIAPYVRYAT